MINEWIKQMDFVYPGAFYLLGLIPLLIIWYVVTANKRTAVIKVSSIRAFNRNSFKTKLRHLPFILRLLALTALIIALARPQKRNDEQLTGGEGIDIILCMDVSGSMLSRDFQPNRLEVAKEMAAEFIRHRPVDRIGLVIFSGESYMLAPLTSDHNMLLTQINGLTSGLLPDGTLIGEGLAMAVDKLTTAKSKSKVIILLTDGRERRTKQTIIDPYTALEIAKARGVKVYTIGMAREGYEAVQEKTDIADQISSTQAIDEALLKKIALETGGQFFRARDKEGLEDTYNQIDRMEKVKVEQSAFKRTEEKYLLFVLAALTLVFLEVILRFTVLRKFP